MPLALNEQISLVLKGRLEAMIGDTATYPIDVCEVIRPTRSIDWTPRDRQIVLVQGQPEIVEELMRPGNPPATAYRQTYQIRCHLLPSERQAETIDEMLNMFHADVVRAVCSGSSTWHTFDGLAVDAQWKSPEYVSADGGIDGVNVPIAITYRTDEDDPTEVRA
jgi:hypothetical protein